MVQLWMEMRFWAEYILGVYFRLFRNVSFWDPSNNSYHYMVLGYLYSTILRENYKYLRRHTRLPIQPRTTPTREDGLFADLHRAISKPRARESSKDAWISDTT